jgi:hypothetical protein
MNKLKLSLAVALLAFAGAAAAQSVSLNWGAVTQDANGAPLTGSVSYNIYQGTKGQVTKTKVTSSVTTTAALTSALFSGKEVCWNVTTVVGADESVYSNEACKTFPAAKPKAPANLSAE